MRRYLTLVFLGIIVLEAALNSNIFIHRVDAELGYSDRLAYTRFHNALQSVVDKINHADPGFFRIEKTFSLTYNDSLDVGYKGVTHYSSSFVRSTASFLKQLGFHQALYRILYSGATIPADSILGIKYILTKQPEDNSYQLFSTQNTQTDKTDTYLNPFALPLGFMVNRNLANVKMDPFNPIDLQDRILQAMTGLPSGRYFVPVKIERIDLENVSSQDMGGTERYAKIDAGKEGFINMTIKVENENPIYTYLLTNGNSKVEVFIDGISLGYYCENSENNQIISFGKHRKGDEISLKLRLMKDEFILQKESQIYQLDMDRFTRAYNQFDSQPLLITRFSDTFVHGKVNVSQANSILFTSIPYDAGWNVWVDGQQVEKMKILDTFIGVSLTSGLHQVDFYYTLPGFSLGLGVSAVSMLIAAWIYIYSKKTGHPIIHPK